MRKQLAALAILALASGTASAQSLPSAGALIGPLTGGADALVVGIKSGTNALVGTRVFAGDGVLNPERRSGLTGGAALLTSTLAGVSEQANAGITEGGDQLGNNVDNVVDVLNIGIDGGSGALVGGIAGGSEALVALIEQGADQLAGAAGTGGSPLSGLGSLSGLAP